MGRGLPLVGNVVLMRIASIHTAPIGRALTGAWTAIDIAGAAYRVTVPAVIEIAFLRKLSENRAEIARVEQEHGL